MVHWFGRVRTRATGCAHAELHELDTTHLGDRRGVGLRPVAAVACVLAVRLRAFVPEGWRGIGDPLCLFNKMPTSLSTGVPYHGTNFTDPLGKYLVCLGSIVSSKNCIVLDMFNWWHIGVGGFGLGGPLHVGDGRRAMLQNLSEEIRECLLRAEECKRKSKTALCASAIKDYLDMEQRWLARSYEFAERLSDFTKPFRGRNETQT
jgi:hypothetical protein